MREKPWKILEISKATYYRYLKNSPHGSLTDAYVQWKSDSLYEVQWSHGYQRRSLYQLRKYLSVFPLVHPKGLAAWMAEIPPDRFSNRKDRHAAVSNFAKFLNSRCLLSNTDYTAIRNLYPKKSRYYRPRQKIITESDLRTILTHAEPSPIVYASIMVLSETALRLAEYCALIQPDLFFSPDPTQAKLLVQKGKGGKMRWVPFSRRAQEHIIQSWQAPGYRWLMNRFKELSEEIGIPFSAHSFRHYRITKWANNPRIPITTTQLWAGHETLTVTQGYIHLTNEEALRAAFE